MARVNEEDLIGRIRKQLEQEPAVDDPMQIDLLVKRRGGLLKRHTVINVSGRISNEVEGRKIEDAVRTAVSAMDGVEIENNLVVPLV